MKRWRLPFLSRSLLRAALLLLAGWWGVSPARAVGLQELLALFSPGADVEAPHGVVFLRIEGHFCTVLLADDNHVAALLVSRGENPGELVRKLRERLPSERGCVLGGKSQEGRDWSALVFEERLPTPEKLSLDGLVRHSPTVAFSYFYTRVKASLIGVDAALVTWKINPREKASPLLILEVEDEPSPGCFRIPPGKERTMGQTSARSLLRKLGLSARAARSKETSASSYLLDQGTVISSYGGFCALLTPSGELLFGARHEVENRLERGVSLPPQPFLNLTWPPPEKETKEKPPPPPQENAGKMTPADAFRAYKDYLQGL